MEAGKFQGRSVDLIDAMVMGADETCSDAQIAEIERCACPGCGSCSGMFTANSMNCLTEALGLSLPGNGTIVATHVNRRRLFEDAAALIVRNAERYYFEGDERVLPRSITTKAAFENAMSLDIAMGGSTNTVLHLLAVAHEAGVDFTMQDIDRLSRRVPVLCKVAPNSHYHIQDVNRAGGIFAILGELDRAGLLDTSVLRVDGRTLGEAIPACDILNPAAADAARRRALSAPAGHYSRELGAQHSYYEEPDTDRTAGCIRDVEHAYFRDGGLAVLTGNIARQGCVVKTAGVDEKLFVFRGPARVYESQEQAMNGILADEVQPGEVVVIRYEGPKGGPGMQEMLYPTSYLKSKHLDKACALITDGRFSGGTSGLSIGHVSPEAASGGEIAVVRTGDEIEIDIPGRSIRLAVDDAEIAVWPSIKKHLTPGKALYFSHGFGITYKERTGIVPPADVDVILIAPKGSGTSLRRMFLQGRGLNSSYAVFQDATGRAFERVVALGIGVGSGYLFETDFKREVYSDLTGERGTLMGAIQGIFAAQYDTLRANGHTPSEAFNETVEELTQSLMPLVSENGMDWMYANCSTTAQRGALDWWKKFRDATKPVFEELYREVAAGNEAQRSIDLNSKPDYREKLNEELREMRESEMWQTGAVVRKLRPENN